MSGTPRVGTITWTDLTVENAGKIREFYQAVIGWTAVQPSIGAAADFVMQAEDGNAVAGICDARESNASLPPVWLLYITVDDLDHSVEQCQRLGGALVDPPRSYAGGRCCVIRDPAGALCALYQPADAA